MGKKKQKPHFPDTPWGKVRAFWWYVWNGDDLWSWVLSIVIAFIIIRYIAYPLMGLLLGTPFPVVAVVSGSMEHKISDAASNVPVICGNQFDENDRLSFDEYWNVCGEWYESQNITSDQFREFSFKNGMNTGDVIIISNPGAEGIEVGDVIVFTQSTYPQINPIIHRVIDKDLVNGEIIFQTKGDHNGGQAAYELNVPGDTVMGKSVARIPWLGYVKIWFTNIILFIVGIFR